MSSPESTGTIGHRTTVGRLVHYVLTAVDAQRINKRLMDFEHYRKGLDYQDTGYVAHFGNYAHEGDILPLMVVRVWGEHSVNGQVFLDGNNTLWVTSVPEGEGPGTWSWPPRV